MPKFIQWTNPVRVEKLTHIMKIKGADVYVHWTVLVVAALMIAATFRQPVLTVVGLLSYLSVLMIHETGHLILAQRRGSKVFEIKIYPICGFTYFETPWSRLDHCIIAWGGVLAQGAVAIPFLLWVELFGFTRVAAVNAALAILGFFSVGVALFNLLPIPPLDGATAWGLIPALIERARLGRRTPPRWKR